MRAQSLIYQGLLPISDSDIELYYQEMLNDVYGNVNVAGYEYTTAEVLASMNPLAYRCGLADYISAELEDRLVEVDGVYFERDDIDSINERIDN
jgi:hypothetical protein